ncbi:peptidase domain-containing ABC transporter [Asticcacaulis solisilvae]|uniref:peptidase domain-containing ABC transporter n=1 Tax=Asticcacaulis solisilvae TaxID=1217274 RepID=UPI003FD8C230
MGWDILKLKPSPKLPLIRQTEAAECALACVAMVAGYYGYETDLATLRQRFALSLKGATLKNLIGMANAIHLGSRPVKCDLEDLKKLRLPAVLHWGMNHFVVLSKLRGGKLYIFDPSGGSLWVDAASASKYYTGIAVEMAPSEGFTPRKETKRLTISSLLAFSADVRKALGQALLISIVVECFAIATPFYMQILIDQVVIADNYSLLKTVTIAFAFILLFDTVSKTVRGFILQYISSILSYEMKARIFHHLIRLPLEWFHKRQVGDIQNRYNSILPIREFISNKALEILMDGVLSVGLLGIMIYYSPGLTLISVVAVGLYVAARLVMYRATRVVAMDRLMSDAGEQTKLLETLRAIQTIKSASAEPNRESLQRNVIVNSINNTVRFGTILITYTSISGFITGAADLLVAYIGVTQIMSSAMTVGMLMAFMAYKTQFTGRGSKMVEQLLDWRLLEVHLERISDIALSPVEDGIDEPDTGEVLQGGIACRDLAFRYAPAEPDALTDINLSIEPGEFVAVVGPSGCGKSTLLKLLTGLYTATSGHIYLDGKPIREWSPSGYRRQIAYISQDDQLLSGTIAENISGFGENVDESLVAECAYLANIHDEINQMPMGYESLVGDMGSVLSGGQKQRVLIARALYARPKILIMDEGTAHLDAKNEQAINTALSRLKITRIIVAHRQETIAAADRTIRLLATKSANTLIGTVS